MQNNNYDKLHKQHAHCESGVTSNLFNHYNIPISEPLAFGIGAGIFFGHVPFLKVGGIPATTYRIWPGYIFKRTAQRLNIKVSTKQFSNPNKGMQALDDLLNKGIPVGLITSVYYLDYLPEAFRFHFNAHNILVFGKNKDGDYLVSDPLLESTTTISAASLMRARFPKGFPEPKGKLYYINDIPATINIKPAIIAGIKKSCWFMTSPPVPWFGINGIYTLGRKVEKYGNKLPERKAKLYLGNIIRMQEEIGTGGGGFRFLYAAFLQEAATVLEDNRLNEFSVRFTKIGDMWRNFAFEAAKLFKQRTTNNNGEFTKLKQLLFEIADNEKAFFKDLATLKFA